VGSKNRPVTRNHGVTRDFLQLLSKTCMYVYTGRGLGNSVVFLVFLVSWLRFLARIR
jgi:hypothetical protein